MRNNYIVKYSHEWKTSFLLLVRNVDHEFQFVDLGTGELMNVFFETEELAEQWLHSVGIILEKNIICPTYVLD